MRALRALLKAALGLVALLLLAVAGGCLWLHTPRPDGTPGAEADALAHRMMAAVDADAWSRVRVVQFTFGGRNRWVWDRAGQRAWLRQGELDVRFHTDTRDGYALKGGRRLAGPYAERALEDAWAQFCNDTFWLNPVVKAFDMGTERLLVPQDDGSVGLMVRYLSGGVTPGDAYLWRLDERARPLAWQMWVKILPVGGVEASWDGWTQLPGGAWISTRHALGPVDLALTDLAVADDVEVLAPGVFTR